MSRAEPRRMLGRIRTATLAQGKATPITVETLVASGGLPNFITVGLPDSAVKESRLRIETALRHIGFALPPRRILVNLAPADIRKAGSGFDLAIALSVLCAFEQSTGGEGFSPATCQDHLVVGELGLDGRLRPVSGGVLFVELARSLGLRAVILPEQSAEEASVVPGISVLAATSLSEVVSYLQGRSELRSVRPEPRPELSHKYRCLGEVRGREHEKWALAVAAHGRHHVLLEGSPGVGKTMLAERFLGLLPKLTEDEQVAVIGLYALAGQPPPVGLRPFRAPHHSLSHAALLGGGPMATPGEVSLAHTGVLFLDELSEMRAEVLNGLRQPLEAGVVSISRAQRRAEHPARFTLIAATNPCPCGNHGHALRECRCAPAQLERYRQRLRGPVVDRLDVVLHLSHRAETTHTNEDQISTTAQWLERLAAASQIQDARAQTVPNSLLSVDQLKEFAPLGQAEQSLLRLAATKMALSERALCRVRRLARSIADLDTQEAIATLHLEQALALRVERLQK